MSAVTLSRPTKIFPTLNHFCSTFANRGSTPEIGIQKVLYLRIVRNKAAEKAKITGYGSGGCSSPDLNTGLSHEAHTSLRHPSYSINSILGIHQQQDANANIQSRKREAEGGFLKTSLTLEKLRNGFWRENIEQRPEPEQVIFQTTRAGWERRTVRGSGLTTTPPSTPPCGPASGAPPSPPSRRRRPRASPTLSPRPTQSPSTARASLQEEGPSRGPTPARPATTCCTRP